MPAPEPWYRRLRRRWSGERTAYSGRLSGATVAFRALAAAVVVLAVVAVLTLAGAHPVRRLTDQIGHLRGSGRISGLTAEADPVPRGVEDTAAWAVDDVRDRGWSTAWVAATGGSPETACPATSPDASGTGSPAEGDAGQGTAQDGSGEGTAGRQGSGLRTAGQQAATASSLVLTLPEPVDVREIGIEAGLSAKVERDTHWQPRTLELRWAGGGCQRIDLRNTGELQRFRVEEPVTSGLVVSVVAGYPPVDPGPNLLDIGEITLWQR